MPADSNIQIPGAVSVEPPAVEEPTTPAGTASAQARPAGTRSRVADRQPHRRPGALAGTVRRLPHHGAGAPALRHGPLAEGRTARPGAAPGPPPAREDHPLRPRAHPGTRGPRPRRRSARRLPLLRVGVEHHPRRLPGQGRRDPGLRPLLHRPGLPRFGGHRPGHPRLRHQVLHRRGHVRPGRQQHPGLLHPGRHQVPGHHPRRQTASGPRNPAGPERPRHLLGLRFAAHRGAGPHHVEHVRPRPPALLPDHGGLRRPHLPLRQRRGQDQPGEVPLEAEAGRPLAGLGGSPAHQRHGPGLPPAGPCRRDRGRRLPAVGARRAGLPGHRGGVLRGDRPAGPHQVRPRGARPGAADRHS